MTVNLLVSKNYTSATNNTGTNDTKNISFTANKTKAVENNSKSNKKVLFGAFGAITSIATAVIVLIKKTKISNIVSNKKTQQTTDKLYNNSKKIINDTFENLVQKQRNICKMNAYNSMKEDIAEIYKNLFKNIKNISQIIKQKKLTNFKDHTPRSLQEIFKKGILDLDSNNKITISENKIDYSKADKLKAQLDKYLEQWDEFFKEYTKNKPNSTCKEIASAFFDKFKIPTINDLNHLSAFENSINENIDAINNIAGVYEKIYTFLKTKSKNFTSTFALTNKECMELKSFIQKSSP